MQKIKQHERGERGFYDYRSNGPLLAVVWMDKRYIYFLSTLHSAETSGNPTTVQRRQIDGTRVDVVCPPPLTGLSSIHAGC